MQCISRAKLYKRVQKVFFMQLIHYCAHFVHKVAANLPLLRYAMMHFHFAHMFQGVHS